MDRLPAYIMVLALKLNKDTPYKNVTKLLNDYFKGLPSIPYTDYLADSKNIYYILPDSYVIATSLNNIYDFVVNNLDMDIFRYATYSHIWGDDPNLLPTYTLGCYNVPGTQRLPPRITINANVVEKLKSISEDYYD